MTIAHISLIGIILAIAIGFWRNINTGLVSIAFAFIIGHFMGNIAPNTIISFWPTRLFFILFGVTFVFSIAKVNGTMESLARKSVFLARGNTRIIPWIFFLLALGLAALGPGNISIAALLGPIAMAVAAETGIYPALMAGVMITGAVAGGLSPIAPTGIIGVELAAAQGLSTGMYVWVREIAAGSLYAVLLYSIFGGWKLKNVVFDANNGKPAPFNRDQMITLAGIAALIISVLVFKKDIGLSAFTVAAALLLLKVAPENKSLAGVPWGTLLLVSGTGILIEVSARSGGIDVLTGFLQQFMTASTAPGFMAVIAGVMSFFSSASGVVMPALIRTVPSLVEAMGGSVSAPSIIAAIVIGSHMVTPSPISTMGALLYAGATDSQDKKRLFRDLLFIGLGGIVFAGIISLFIA